MQKSERQRLEQNLQWWQAQLTQVQKDRRNMKWVFAATPLAIVASFWSLFAGVALFAIILTTWALGLYITSMRSYEFAENVRDAKQTLERCND